jgi:hypothetical protein
MAPWVAIEKPSTEFHLELAKEFAEAESGDVRSSLRRILEGPRWYLQFSSMANNLGGGGKWAAFRTTRLSAILEHSLLKLGIPLNALRQPASAVGSEIPTPRRSHEHSLSDVLSSGGDEASLRHAIAKIVETLPMDELRALRLPLGSVLDAIGRK